jgi:hemolysin III
VGRIREYSANEERANAFSHAFGILLGIAGGIILLQKAFVSADNWKIVSVFVYLYGMLSSYISSTVYHACTNHRKPLLQKFDHAAIYLHIAGSYTPFTLVVLRGEGVWGWCIFSVVWIAALIGVIISFRRSGKHSNIETICYVVMGCTIFVAFKPLIDILQRKDAQYIVYWLIAGGVSYIVGALFYSLTKVKYLHTVFHLFVLTGSVFHIIAIYDILKIAFWNSLYEYF